jgi:hypothetical protein
MFLQTKLASDKEVAMGSILKTRFELKDKFEEALYD